MKGQPVQIEVSDKAFQLAKEWVKNMTGGKESENEDMEDFEGRFDVRPARLGLGAKYVSHSQVASTMNPVEKKLRAKLGASKLENSAPLPRKSSSTGKSALPEQNDNELEDEEDGKTSVFNRKQPSSSARLIWLESSSSNGKKKRKRGQAK